MVERVQIITIVITTLQLLLGVLLLIASSLFLHDNIALKDICELGQLGSNLWLKLLELSTCTTWTYFEASASTAIVASLLQIVGGILSFLKRWKVWCILHILVFLGTLIAFSIAMSENAHKIYADGTVLNTYERNAQFFLAMCGIDSIFALLVMPLMPNFI